MAYILAEGFEAEAKAEEAEEQKEADAFEALKRRAQNPGRR